MYVTHKIKPQSALLLIYFLYTICQNSDMFRAILVIFRELLNIDEEYIKHSTF